MASIGPIQEEWRWKKWSHTARRIQIAARRPALSIRRGLWIALLGPSVENGIVGIDFMVEGALRAFDVIYKAGSRFTE
jgi:hypothetical protein